MQPIILLLCSVRTNGRGYLHVPLWNSSFSFLWKRGFVWKTESVGSLCAYGRHVRSIACMILLIVFQRNVLFLGLPGGGVDNLPWSSSAMCVPGVPFFCKPKRFRRRERPFSQRKAKAPLSLGKVSFGEPRQRSSEKKKERTYTHVHTRTHHLRCVAAPSLAPSPQGYLHPDAEHALARRPLPRASAPTRRRTAPPASCLRERAGTCRRGLGTRPRACATTGGRGGREMRWAESGEKRKQAV